MGNAVRPDEVSAILKKELADFESKADVYEVGTVLQVGDGIARVYGLEKVMAGELVEFPNQVMGMVFNLEEDNVGVILFGEEFWESLINWQVLVDRNVISEDDLELFTYCENTDDALNIIVDFWKR